MGEAEVNKSLEREHKSIVQSGILTLEPIQSKGAITIIFLLHRSFEKTALFSL